MYTFTLIYRWAITAPFLCLFFVLSACGGGGSGQSSGSETPIPAVSNSGIYVAQTYAQPAGEQYQQLVPGKDALIMAPISCTDNCPTKVLFSISDIVNSMEMTCPSGTSWAPELPIYDKAETCYVTIDGSLVQAREKLDLHISAGNETFSGEANVSEASALNIRVVPLVINGRTATLPSNASIASKIEARMPFSTVNVSVRTPWAPEGNFDDNLTGTDNACLPSAEPDPLGDFGCVLSQLEDLRAVEAPHQISYAFVPTQSNFGGGVTGLAYTGFGRGSLYSSMGFDSRLDQQDGFAETRRWYNTMLHELGHNLSLEHTPCGGASNIDRFWLLNNWDGAIYGDLNPETPLYNQETDLLLDPAMTGLSAGGFYTGADVMGYCGGEWFSEYNFGELATYASKTSTIVSAQYTQPTTESPERALQIAMASKTMPTTTSVLRFSGKIRNGKITLSPIRSVRDLELTPNQGEYILRLITQDGQIINQRFNVSKIEDAELSTGSHFFVSVAHPGELKSVEILQANQRLYYKQSQKEEGAGQPQYSSSTESGAGRVNLREENEQIHLKWDHQSYPWLQLVHVADDGQRTAFVMYAQGGVLNKSVKTLPLGGRWEVSLSDGLNSTLQYIVR